MIDKLRDVERRFEAVEAEYHDPSIVSNPKEMQRLGKLRAELEPIVLAYREYDKAIRDLRSPKGFLKIPK